MTNSESIGGSTVSIGVDSLRHLVRTCDAFEAEWRAGRRPRIEDHLDKTEPNARRNLLTALLELEWKVRKAQGEQPEGSEYQARFPEDIELIERLFADLRADDENAPGVTKRLSMGATTAWVPSAGETGSETNPGPVGPSRYRAIQPHAQGGLGVVYLAQDTELDRQVALKEIQVRHADNPRSQAAFVREAFITGGLEHPGVVSVHGFGRYPDGRPYYAMRFIHGDSLQDAIDAYHAGKAKRSEPSEQSMGLRRLISQLIHACNAIAYAHDRGVLHRDIKPSNIMVGKYGETLVVDWGLAKVIGAQDRFESHGGEPLLRDPPGDSANHQTRLGDVLGTPHYMSPEQTSGEPDRLGPASDVYSLGATLYTILTGRDPYAEHKTLNGLFAAIRQGRLPPPRALDPTIDKALEAICLKAMAPRPEDRYPSAKAFAQDLEQWQADEPVDAYREPWTRRLTRWLKRHRTSVATAAAAVLVGVVGLGAVTVVQTRARNELDRKNTELAKANAALDQQRRRAEQREQQAIGAVRRFSDAVADNPILKDSPELEKLRKTLLKEPLEFFENLREQLQDDAGTRPETLMELTEVIHEYAHLTHEVGNPQDGLKAHDDSLAICQALARADPSNRAYQTRLAFIQNCRGNFLKDTGKREAARRAYEAALAIQRRLADESPESPDHASSLGGTLNNLATLDLEARRFAEARDHLEAAIDRQKKALAANPRNPTYRQFLANHYHALGKLLRQTGEPKAAQRALESAIRIRRRLADEHPANAEYRSALVLDYQELGDLLRRTGEPEAARRAFETELTIRQRLADDHPMNTEYRRALATNYRKLGELLSQTGQFEAARRAFESALEIRQRLADQYPTNTQYQRALASSQNRLGVLLKHVHEPEAARRAFEAALQIRQRLASEHPESPDDASSVGGTLNNLATLHLDAKRFAEARDRLNAAIDWQKKALAVNPRHPTYRQFLRNHYTNLWTLAGALGDADLAKEAEHGLAELRASNPRFQARLNSVRESDDPERNAERLQLAQHAYEARLYAVAAQLWGAALRHDPSLTASRRTQHAYNAACAAALAASGKGLDELTPQERAQLRARALSWLKDELAIWSELLASGDEPDRAFIAKTLQWWREDSDLAGVRASDALAALPEEERTAWESLWSAVNAVEAQARSSRPSTDSSPDAPPELPETLFATGQR